MMGTLSILKRIGNRKTQAKLKFQGDEERWRTLLESTQDGLWDWDVKANKTVCSDRWKAMRGFAPDELEIGSDERLRGVHPDDLEQVTQALDAHTRNRVPFDVEYRTVCKDKSYIWVRDRAQAIWDKSGNVVRIVGSETDITARKLAEEELKRQYQRSQLLSDITLKIRQSLSLDEVLKTAATEVQQFLQANRVIVFKLQANGSGKVVQESVTSGWTALQDYNIVDPCFREQIIEQYRQGRTSSISDITQANIQPCHIELLSQFEVKANLVVPILFKDNLWGLLIAHQCSEPRDWTKFETELLQQIADRMGIALAQAQMFNQLEQEVNVRTAELSVTNSLLQEEVNERRRAEAAIKESEAKYRALVETAQSMIWSVNAEGRISFVNSAAKQIYGYEPAEMIGCLFADFEQSQTANGVQEKFEQLLTKETSVQFEQTHRSKSGKSINLLFNAIALKSANGQVEAITGTASDITDMKWEESFQSIKNHVLELMAQGRSLREILLILTQETNHFLPGLRTTIMLMQPDQQTLSTFVGPDMPLKYIEAINQVPIGPSVGSCSTAAYFGQRVIVQDITTHKLWIDYQELVLPYRFRGCWSEPIKSDKQQVLGIFGLYFDEPREPEPRELKLIQACAELSALVITRKQSEEALRQSESLLRSTTDALPAMIGYIDQQERYQFVNRAYEVWHGKPRKEILGHSVREVVGDLLYQKITPYIEGVLLGNTTQVEKEMPTAQGGTRFISGTYIPDWVDGQVQGFFFLGNDITEQKETEKMKDEFISVVSHELRTPLTSIYGSLKLLKTSLESQFSEDDRYMLDLAVDSSDRLVRLVNDVLDLERIASGKVKVVQQRCRATEILAQAVAVTKAIAAEKEISLSVEALPIEFMADPDYVHQVLTNLIGNAIKFSPLGSTIRLSAQAQESEVLFAVKDRGRGIPSNKLERIFERFHQVDASDSREKGGTGLGLAICRNIIRGHGGKIWAKSAVHQGSTFYFTLPLCTAKS